ncbi:MAG TPA: hypothetical protein VGF80_04905 [Galbitalea sp.]|jgi:hypothetical protein
MSIHNLGKPMLAAASTLVGLALAVSLAGPASAAPPPTTPPPALTAFQNQTSIAASAPAAKAAVGTHFATPAALQGERQTFTRGGALAWSSDTFEWYWNGAAMSSSSAYQADGYVFPNTVTLLGVKRSLATASEHLWHGTAAIGAGVVTPWGSVNVYTTTITDNFTLTPGKLTHTS